MDELRGVPLRIPPLNVQKEIVSKVDSLTIETQNLVRLYRRKVDWVQSLKQAVLQKAFSGELTSPPSQAIKEAAE
jgi:type I restriction enzyme S subunit